MKPLKTLFVIVDGGRARWVKRSDSADDFVTFRELNADPAPRRRPEGVAFEGGSGQRFNVELKQAAQAEDKVRFAEQVAAAINAETAEGSVERLAVVAPPRMLAAIRQRLCAKANARLARTLSKNLTKTPDHALGAWLRQLERA